MSNGESIRGVYLTSVHERRSITIDVTSKLYIRARERTVPAYLTRWSLNNTMSLKQKNNKVEPHERKKTLTQHKQKQMRTESGMSVLR